MIAAGPQKDKLRILLLFPSNNMETAEPECRPDDLLMKVVPIGLMSLGAYLEEQGIGVEILDCRFMTAAEACRALALRTPRYRFFGISAMTSQTKHALALADQIKAADPTNIVIWGGVHVTLFPEETARDGAVDYAFRGEAEVGLARLLELLHAGAPALEALEKIPGLAWRAAGEGGRVRVNAEAPPPSMDELPPPAYHLLEIENYIPRRQINGRLARGLDILTSRGCPYRCAFCVVPFLSNRKWRPVGVERVLQDMEDLVARYDLDYLWIMDDYFFGNKKWVNGIVDGMLARNFRFQWEANVRADNFRDTFVNDDLLVRMKKSGCYALRMGLESGSERVLKLISKDVKLPMLENAVRRASEVGIMTCGTWLMGVPGETRAEVEETLALINRLHKLSPLDPHWAPGIYRPYPGGELYGMALENGFIPPKTLRDWGAFNLHWGTVSARMLPWVQDPDFLDDVVRYGEMVISEHLASRRMLAPRKVFDRLARLRYENGYWNLRADAWLYERAKRGYTALQGLTHRSVAAAI